MRVAITGASGLIGSRLVAELRKRGDSVVAISRDPERASQQLGVEARRPAEASLVVVDAVVNLAGEPIDQRWSEATKERIRSSRVEGTEALVAALAETDSRPQVLVSASAAGYYGDRGDRELDESAPPGDDFLASVCVDWERVADSASEIGMRVVKIRTGIVLDRAGGALKKMLPPFKAGLGGPIAGGHHYMSWIALEDLVGIYLAALSAEDWSEAINASAPAPVTNADFARSLGRAIHRPAVIPVPAFALRLLYGELASVVTASQRMVPRRALELGYEFKHPQLDGALRLAVQ